ncbi:uncharacterized protein LOC133876698 [Alnus glutinosa]|uniref:uncharacterized protein LOC133876698 n=1 Tax=Alnus glutinosa TaxID=3517 RepID=UPI002D77BCF4|nr:uncharacterized protein LOC133876698 [Alnus glutinosa]
MGKPHSYSAQASWSNGHAEQGSAYHLGKEIQQWSKGACSSIDAKREVWKVLWSLKIPNSVKVFLWKACHNLLPTKANLLKRKVVEDGLCPCCGREDETVLHALWDCPSAQDVWGCGASCFKKCYTVGDNFLQLFEHFLHRFSPNNLELLEMVARRIWLQRNSLVFEGKFLHPNTLYAEAISACDDFYCSTKTTMVLASVSVDVQELARIWKAPSAGLIKINWDAALKWRTNLDKRLNTYFKKSS